MPTMPFNVTVTWNAGSNDVDVNPDPVPAFEAVQQAEEAQITWRATNGSFASGAFAWKGTPNPGWTPTLSASGTLVSPVFNPQNQPNWMYDITITDSNGTAHTKDPEIKNEEPPPVGGGKPPRPPHGHPTR